MKTVHTRKKRTEFPRNHRTGKPTKKCYQFKRNPILVIIFDIQLIQMSNELTFFFVRGEIKTNAKWLSMCLAYLVIFAHRQVVFPWNLCTHAPAKRPFLVQLMNNIKINKRTNKHQLNVYSMKLKE